MGEKQVLQTQDREQETQAEREHPCLALTKEE